MPTVFTLGLVLSLSLSLSLSLTAWSQDGQSIAESDPTIASDVDDSRVDYIQDVQPLLAAHCYECHSSTIQESNFRLDVRARALAEADWGEPAIVPGDSANSLLIKFVTGDGDLLMPPAGSERLSAKQIDTLRRWIDQGADWPDDLAGNDDQPLTTDHWSFQPIQAIEPPNVESESYFSINGPIDQFVYQRLRDKQLTPSPPANRETFIRRVYLDMLGLMPPPAEVAAFQNDQSPTAYANLVDQILASPHYGERWARHWLDVVRFGESTGFEVNQERPNAYHYRDYVINALNSDKPYTDFIKEQLAGDVLGVDEATGFLVGGPYDTVKSPDIVLTSMQRQDELADYVNTTSTTFLGLTVGCARCHNHKFDPILQRDFYAIQAIFAGVEHGERKLQSRETPEHLAAKELAKKRLTDSENRLMQLLQAATGTTVSTNPTSETGLLPKVNAQKNVDHFEPRLARYVRFTIHRTNEGEPCIDELEIFRADDETNLALASAGAVATSSGDYQGNPKHRLEHVNDGQYGNDRSWIASQTNESWLKIELPEPFLVNQIIWGRDRNGQFQDRLPIRYTMETSLDDEKWELAFHSSQRMPFDLKHLEFDELSKSLAAESMAELQGLVSEIETARAEIVSLEQQIPTAYVGTFKPASVIHRLHRGEPLSPLEEVQPDTLTVMGTLQLDGSTPEQERRRRFAEWIASKQNPLTARVIVNRVWHYHFGRGLVRTTSDFGKNGEPPSHPDLLDWLAREFMEQGWSLKWLHRQILLSSTYRQASAPRQEALTIDAESRLLWRYPPRRLEAESIRDCVLQVSDKLNPNAGGRGFILFEVKKETVHHYSPLLQFKPEHFRRMIYMTKIRQEQDDVFGVFDCPDGGQAIASRNQSTTALQALNLLNSPFMIEQADFLAERLQREAGEQAENQIRLAWQLLFCREPTELDQKDAIEFIAQFGLSAFCRALLNANEFLYLS